MHLDADEQKHHATAAPQTGLPHLTPAMVQDFAAVDAWLEERYAEWRAQVRAGAIGYTVPGKKPRLPW